ncbi:hypothetical protein GCM10023186_07070 [Hymenobacter koreensis]|uniref:Uncharacterized protein n=1 Tax=Hymenobacter koreensis TaxID=1084523 RepID=A0ABP8IVT4_9BACT
MRAGTEIGNAQASPVLAQGVAALLHGGKGVIGTGVQYHIGIEAKNKRGMQPVCIPRPKPEPNKAQCLLKQGGNKKRVGTGWQGTHEARQCRCHYAQRPPEVILWAGVAR